MAEKSIMKKVTLAGSTTQNEDFAPIPNGQRWRVRKFGAVDINNGDNKSSVYLLRWGTVGSFQELRAISLTGNTYEFDISKDLVGDGAKFVRIMLQNNSTSSKDLAFWLEAHSR